MAFLTRLVPALVSALDFNLRRWYREYLAAVIALAVLGGGGYFLFLAPPAGFPAGAIIVIPEGATLTEVGALLGHERVIESPNAFELFVRMAGAGRALKAGSYRFAAPANALTVAGRIVRGESGIPSVRITFFEGMTAREMGVLAAKQFPNISAESFRAIAEPYEGYLFPDTYRLLSDARARDILVRLRAAFAEKIAPLQSAIAASGHPLSDIVIMASLVEKEAQNPEDQRIIAGILWNRIRKGLPLQVDAVFGYIEGRAEFAPSLAELSTDSPYNTYKHKGLPPGPIANPGLGALRAAIAPEKTRYLFYLTGRDGLMHYAATFAEHQANRQAYQ